MVPSRRETSRKLKFSPRLKQTIGEQSKTFNIVWADFEKTITTAVFQWSKPNTLRDLEQGICDSQWWSGGHCRKGQRRQQRRGRTPLLILLLLTVFFFFFILDRFRAFRVSKADELINSFKGLLLWQNKREYKQLQTVQESINVVKVKDSIIKIKW